MNNLSKIVEIFASNHWILALVTVCTLISLPLSVFLYIKSTKKKIPSYDIQTFSLISGLKDKVSKLKVIYDDKEVETLSITRVIFVNLGSDIISKNDIVSKNPLRICLKNNLVILKSECIYRNENNSNEFKINIEDNQVLITFDFLEQYGGGVIEIIHNGLRGDIEIKGKIKGVNKLNQIGIVKEEEGD